MKRMLIVLFVGLITAAGLSFYMHSALSQESDSPSGRFDSMRQSEVSTMVPGSGSFLLVADNFENYDIYKYNSNRSPSYDLQTYYDLYGIPIYELYKNWLKYGGYIGSPLNRSKRELYNDCLMHSRYTYECQRGEQR
jgi:hypothetical protein